MATYIRVPAGNSSRNENELRSAIDQLTAVRIRLQVIADKLAQMNLDGIDRITAEYNLASDADAQVVLDLVSSAATEQQSAGTPFSAQLVSRLG